MTGLYYKSQAFQPACVCVCVCVLMLMAYNYQQYFLVLLADGFHNYVDILGVWYA